MVEQKQVAMILPIILAEKNCKSYIITSGGPLLKFIRKDKVKVIKTSCTIKKSNFNFY